eukprot:1161074-Pelagomonas_calceolata.AAC.1
MFHQQPNSQSLGSRPIPLVTLQLLFHVWFASSRTPHFLSDLVSIFDAVTMVECVSPATDQQKSRAVGHPFELWHGRKSVWVKSCSRDSLPSIIKIFGTEHRKQEMDIDIRTYQNINLARKGRSEHMVKTAFKATAQSLSGSKIAKCLLVGLPCIGSIASTDREPHIGEVVPGCIQTLAVCLDLGKSSLGSLGLHAGKHERQGN